MRAKAFHKLEPFFSAEVFWGSRHAAGDISGFLSAAGKLAAVFTEGHFADCRTAGGVGTVISRRDKAG